MRSIINTFDESIIDSTGDTYKVSKRLERSRLTKSPTKVVYWRHRYVYSSKVLAKASLSQVDFYKKFKAAFFSGLYYDLEGSKNYAFVLLYELVDAYPNRFDIKQLQLQLEILSDCYPKTRSCSRGLLMKILGKNRDYQNVRRLQQLHQKYYNTHPLHYSLGSRFLALMNLNPEEVELLNIINQYSNTFFDIPACGKEVVRVYLQLIRGLNISYKDLKTNLKREVAHVARVAVAQLHYKAGTESYRYMVEQATQNIYTFLFKRCENILREVHGNKRNPAAENYYTDHPVMVEFENRILNKIEPLLQIIKADIRPPDEEIEIQLNAQNTSRWKSAFQQIVNDSRGNPALFKDKVIQLAQLNKRNPSIEMIYFEASKVIASADKEIGLEFYLRYIYCDLLSARFDNWQMTKTIQKSLFTNAEQLQRFEKILSTLIKNKDLNECLSAIPRVYKLKRRKIQLDSVAIKEVTEEHSETVELLNEFLQDENKDDSLTIQAQQINRQEIKMEIISQVASEQEHLEKIFLLSEPIHLSLLTVFQKNNYILSEGDLEDFARTHHVFKNQIIEKINELCFDCLDDVLIEEEADNYILNEVYYRKILVA